MKIPLRAEVQLAAAGFLDGLLADPDDAAAARERGAPPEPHYLRLRRENPGEPVQGRKIA